jgi:hypothetical protein
VNDHPAAVLCEYLINGEPATIVWQSAPKALCGRITTGGRARIAYPEQGESAIQLLDLCRIFVR